MARRARSRVAAGVPYYHVVFTLPGPIGDIAYQNKAVIYDILFKASAETLVTIAADPRAPRRPHRYHLRVAHLGLSHDPEPSLKIPGIIISLIFK